MCSSHDTVDHLRSERSFLVSSALKRYVRDVDRLLSIRYKACRFV